MRVLATIGVLVFGWVSAAQAAEEVPTRLASTPTQGARERVAPAQARPDQPVKKKRRRRRRRRKSPPAELKNLYLEANAFGGYTGTTVDAGARAPTLMQFGLGAAAGYWVLQNWFVGLASDFRFINQYSAADSTVGNRRGQRWNIASAMLGFSFQRLIAKLDFQFLGSYVLANSTSTGSTLSYTQPLGGRLNVAYPVWSGLYVGGFGEYVQFSRSDDSVSGVVDLTTALVLWQTGLSLAYIY